MGNIANYNVEELNDYHRDVVDNLPDCRDCWARYYCGGGCFYFHKARTGDMHRRDPFDCRVMKGKVEGLIHLNCLLDEADRDFLKEVLIANRPDTREHMT